MAWTKREFVQQAFSEIGLSNYAFDLSPEMLNDGLRRLDSMLAGWQNNGIRLGYPTSSKYDGSDLDQDSNIQDIYNEAVYLNLALRLAPSYGRQVLPDTKDNAKKAYDGLLLACTKPPESRHMTMVSGAGNRQVGYFNTSFIPTPKEPITTGDDGILNLGEL
jgi:hypothetical protein